MTTLKLNIEVLLDYILDALDILACKAIDRDQYDEVAPFKNQLRQISVRAETVARLIAAREPTGRLQWRGLKRQ